jgi:hypothetical protein
MCQNCGDGRQSISGIEEVGIEEEGHHRQNVSIQHCVLCAVCTVPVLKKQHQKKEEETKILIDVIVGIIYLD